MPSAERNGATEETKPPMGKRSNRSDVPAPAPFTERDGDDTVGSFFIRLYYFFKTHKVAGIGLLTIFIFSFAFLASRLQFEEDITKLIPASDQSDITNRVLKEVNFADRIVLLLEAKPAGNIDDLTEYAGRFIDSVQVHCDPYIKDIQGKVDDAAILQTLDFIYHHLPLFLDEADYRRIELMLQKDSIAQKTRENYKALVSPMGVIARRTILRDPLSLSFLGLQKLQQLKVGDNFHLHNGFVVSKDSQNLLLFITPRLAANETDANALFVEQLYRIAHQLDSSFADKVSGEYYGTTVVAVANAQQIKRDIQYTVIIALGILLLLLIFFYRKLLVPFIIFLPALLGGLLAAALLYLIKAKTSAISLGIGSILLGITLDYSLHILTHYRDKQDIKQLYRDVTLPILMSSFTTAIAFLCLLFLRSEALQDLGLFAAISVVSASVFALLLIPHLYKTQERSLSADTFLDHFAAYPFHRNKVLVLLCFLLFIGSLFTFKNVAFDQDISKLNYQTKALKATERKLDALMNTASKSVYIAAYGNTTETALIQNEAIFNRLEKLKTDGEIINFNSIASVVLSQKAQQKKIEAWERFWSDDKKTETQKQLLESSTELGFKPTTFQAFYELLNQKFQPITISEYRLVSGLLVNEFISDTTNFATAVSMVKVDDSKLKPLVDEFSAAPQTVVIDRQHLNETFLGGLKDEFNRLIKYSFFTVFIILLLFFRRIELTLITIFPILLTWLLTVGLMGILKIEFNIFNIIISTFIFGLGVDYSIFMTNGLLKEYKYGGRELPTYRTAILLSVITTLLGVGALIFAKHPALASISTVSIMGILSAMLIAFIIQPRLFRFCISGRAQKGYAPLRFRSFIHGIVLFAFYGFGGMLLSVFSITILPLLPFSKKGKMKWLHRTMSRTVTAVLYGNPFVRKEIINNHGEDFKKPAIIISNHASALDTLTIGMVTPNIIYLVNDWVYKSPVFGLLARVTGFYPVSDGVDDSLEHLKEKIRQGYLLVVFPEGKRAMNNKIGRFHKGAFFLAERLQLDILPFYLHGNSEVLPKGDRVIYDGSLTVKVGDRIKPGDTRFGTEVRERTKKITAFYKSEFNKLRQQIEGPEYFKDILLSNYIYKGDHFYKTIKADFQQKKLLYHQLSNALPLKANISHIADDYGQVDILLVASSIDRRITTFIADEEKRTIAAHCYTAVHRKVKYVDSIDHLLSDGDDAEILLITAPAINFKNKFLESTPNVKQIIVLDNATLAQQIEQLKLPVINLTQ